MQELRGPEEQVCSEVVVEGQLRGVLAGVRAAEAGHHAALLVLAHPLLEEVGLAPAHKTRASAVSVTC